ncbi:hypothetical protein CRYPA_1461 [uncultured Candidatus Thioglobus sp.]|nr:hypothetical protein CRYPA_1461 [uncultured Candidatus Thioglobus sp.]
MLTFDKALDLIPEGTKYSILLANGFSQAWNADIFNYANLLGAAKFENRDVELKSLFNDAKTYDFEIIMKQLESAELVLKAYGSNKKILKQIESDKTTLKNALIEAISSTHPERPSDITNEQYETVRTFLCQFNKIFTLNYDLLFYWARNKDNLKPENYNTDDGFRTEKLWKGRETNQNVYFLHGGLHIYDTYTDIKKHTYTQNSEPIVDQVRVNLNNGEFPLFVSEPTHEKKKSRIEHNPYLSYCYRELKDLNEVLFIYGHSMNDNDRHIFNGIKLSGISKIFVSIFGDENSESNARLKENAMSYLKNNNTVEFYQAESARVWA